MSNTVQTNSALRLWPGVAIVTVLWLTRLGAPLVGIGAGTEFLVRVLGGFIGALAVLIWWLFFSRAQWSERLGAVVALLAALAATWLAGHPSILVWLLWYAAPIVSLALVAGTVAGRGLAVPSRRLVTAAAIAIACAPTTLVRIAGVAGNGVAH